MQAYLGRICVVLAGLLASVVTARTLGPEGRGVLALSTTLSTLGSFLCTLGVAQSNHVDAAKNPGAMNRLLGNSLVLGGVVALLLVVLMQARLYNGFVSLPDAVLWATTAMAVVASLNVLVYPLLAGVGRLNLLNAAELFASVGFSVSMVACAAWGVLTPLLAILVRCGLACCSLGIYTVSLSRWLTAWPTVDSSMLRRSIAFGSRFFVANLLAQLLRDGDILLVSYFLGEAVTGLYAIVATIVTLQYVLPDSLISVIFPGLVNLPTALARWRGARKAILICAGASALMCLGAGLAAPYLIGVAFGSKFLGAIPALPWGLLAAWFMVMQRMCSSVHFGTAGVTRGYVAAVAAGLAISITLNIQWIPTRGIVGAAQAACIANLSYLILTLLLIGQHVRAESRPGAA